MRSATVDAYVDRAGRSSYRRFLAHGLADATVAAVVVFGTAPVLPAWFQPERQRPQQLTSSETLVARVARLSGLSDRGIARALGVSHPTVAAMRRGGGDHRVETIARLRALDDLVIRTAALIGDDDPQAVGRALNEKAGQPAISPLEALAERGDAVAAYQQLMRSRSPARPALRGSLARRRASDSVVAVET